MEATERLSLSLTMTITGIRSSPEPCQAAAHLPTLATSCPRRSFHADLIRANPEESASSQRAAARPPLAQPEVAVPSRLPQESGDGRIDHPVEPGADRQDARSGGLGEHPAVRRIWYGRRHLQPASARADESERVPDYDRHQPGLHALP